MDYTILYISFPFSAMHVNWGTKPWRNNDPSLFLIDVREDEGLVRFIPRLHSLCVTIVSGILDPAGHR